MSVSLHVDRSSRRMSWNGGRLKRRTYIVVAFVRCQTALASRQSNLTATSVGWLVGGQTGEERADSQPAWEIVNFCKRRGRGIPRNFLLARPTDRPTDRLSSCPAALLTAYLTLSVRLNVDLIDRLTDAPPNEVLFNRALAFSKDCMA